MGSHATGLSYLFLLCRACPHLAFATRRAGGAFSQFVRCELVSLSEGFVVKRASLNCGSVFFVGRLCLSICLLLLSLLLQGNSKIQAAKTDLDF